MLINICLKVTYYDQNARSFLRDDSLKILKDLQLTLITLGLSVHIIILLPYILQEEIDYLLKLSSQMSNSLYHSAPQIFHLSLSTFERNRIICLEPQVQPLSLYLKQGELL